MREAITVATDYGPWGVVAGGSDGVGVAFGHQMAARGSDVVLVARRAGVLEGAAREIRDRHGVAVRTVTLDLSAPRAIEALAAATSDLEVGLLVYNAGADDRPGAFLAKDLAAHLAMVHGSPLGALSRRAAVLALSNHAPGAGQ
jgi:uncharacterized protein